jgi:hypothetical protein
MVRANMLIYQEVRLMKEGFLKTSNKEKEKWYKKLVIHMKVNTSKINFMAMVFINLKMVIDTLDIFKTTICMVMVFITGHLVLCIKVNTNMAYKQEYHLIITQMVRLIKTFGLKIECNTQ